MATGTIAANLYYAQPLLDTMARSFDTSPDTAGLIVTVTQIGFAVSLVLVLPMADLVRRRPMLTVLLALAAAALATVGLASRLPVALAAFATLGLVNVAAQVLVPTAAQLANDDQRGRTVATVISGLLTGILLARTVAGVVASLVGWRPLFLGAAVLMAVVAVVLRRALRDADPAPQTGAGYGQVMGSTVRLFRRSAALRVRSAYGAVGFAAFSVFWTTIALRLSQPPFGYPSAVIGLFGLLGAAGAAAANLTGRIRRPGRPLPTAIALAAIALAYTVLWAGDGSLAGVVAGVLLLDVGVQGLHVVNQRLIYDVAPAARQRANSVYMTFYFAGGAIGSAAASVMWSRSGWPGICAAGLAIAALGVLLWAATSRGAHQ
ncbi:MFS transporter [Streptomyces sp. enrichment culture]|uniref:MFS transporter n=1 Tax=Streptomyces sp. enrichment culture TaxID=1795815 RepID=UPI003F57F0D8